MAARLLGLQRRQLKQVLKGKRALDEDGTVRDRIASDPWEETGSHAIRKALARVDLDALSQHSDARRARLARALLLQDMSPVTMTLEVLPVLPPDLRPLVPLSGGRFATSDLNDLYRRLIICNARLRRLMELNAPGIILVEESARLYAAVEALFANGGPGRIGRVVHDEGRRLMALRDLVMGHGQKNIMQKRVDYSGCSTLVVDRSVPRGECRVPREMVAELFKPFAFHWLEARGHVSSIKESKRILQSGGALAQEAIGSVSNGMPVLLMSERMVVCRNLRIWDEAALAVDADTAASLGAGSEIAVHVPLGERAREECRAIPDTACCEVAPEGRFFGRLLGGSDPAVELPLAVVFGKKDALTDPLLPLVLGRLPE